MVAFTTVVQADFSGTAFGGAPTWTDISRFARLKASPISINKWRQDELSDVAPSTMTFVLDNAAVTGDATAPNAGRFTPFLSTSPWYPRVLPGVRIRAGVIISGTTYWRFDGYVEAWDASYDDGDFEICTVAASDILARLGSVDVLREPLIEEVLLDAPLALYPLSDAAGSTQAGDISGNNQPAATRTDAKYGPGTLTFGTDTQLPGLAAGVSFDSPSMGNSGQTAIASWLTTPTSAMPAAAPFSVECWFKAPAQANPPVSFEVLWQTVTASGLSSIQMFLGNDVGGGTLRKAYFNLFGLAGSVPASAPFGSLLDGAWHHMVGTLAGDGKTVKIYIDGALLTTSVAAADIGWARPSGAVGSLGAGAGYGHQTASQPFSGTLAGFAIYATELPAARAAAHYSAGKLAFAGESTSAHVTRLLAYRTNLGSTLDTGQGTVDRDTFAGKTLQQALLDTAKGEGGVLYADPTTGQIVLLNRARMRNPATAVTLDITAQQVTADLDFRADRQQLHNDVTISRPTGAAQRLIDTTSKNTYGTGALSDTRLMGTDIDARNAAGWILANDKDVRQRTPSLAVDLLGEPSTSVAASVLGLTPLQRVALSNPPASAPSSDVIIQGCTDTIGVDVFTCQFFVTPLPRPTLRFDASADAFTKLDAGNVFAW